LTPAEPIPRVTVESRRRQILDAAAECARHSGFHRCRMAEIAQAAGLSVGQIYRYFESKEAIIGAIIAEDVAETHRHIVELDSADAPFVEALVECVPTILEDALDPDRAALMLEIAAESARNPTAAKLFQAADTEVRSIVMGVLKQLQIEGSERELAARVEMLSVLFDGMMTRALAHPEVDREALCEVFRSLLRHLLSEPLSKAP
jgi:AcrR family transcriptional regulator